MHVPSSSASRPRSLRLSEGNGSPSGGNPRRWSTQPIDHSTGRHDPAERLEGFSSAALEPLPQPATHALPSQQPRPSTPECKERNHRYQCRSGWAGRVMRSTVHEARQGESREPMRVRWLLRTARSRRFTHPQQNAVKSIGMCRRLRSSTRCTCTLATNIMQNRPSSRLHEAQQARTRVFDGGL